MTYSLEVAGLKRELPICKVTDDLYIGAFICFGDAELTVACARELLKLVPADSYDSRNGPPVRREEVFPCQKKLQGLYEGLDLRGGSVYYHCRTSAAVSGAG